MQQPLISDVSLYTNPHLELDNNDTTTLEELAHLVRLSKYQERRRAGNRVRLQRSLISTALFARLTRCGEVAHRNLYDSFRADDKKSFAAVYNAFIDVRNSCEATRRYALLEPEIEPLTSASSETIEANPIGGSNTAAVSITPFLNEISASSRESFLSFLTQVRTNPDYLATRLCSLSSAELGAFTNFNQPVEPVESVLPQAAFRGRNGSLRGQGSLRGSSHVPSTTSIEKLLSFQRHDPLAALIHTCFANSAGPDSKEDKRRTDIWAAACARLISEGKAKSNAEPIIVSALNAWAAMRDWAGRSNMEWYLMKILEDGAFLLDKAQDPNGTRFNLSDWSQKDNVKADQFYDKAISDLFDILDDEDSTGIPEGALELGQQILRRLDGRYMENTRQWYVYKWLFSDWLFRVMVHPEGYGMMAEYHITEYGRQKILKAVANRAQQLVAEMLPVWNSQAVSGPQPKVKAHVENILARFKPSRSRKPTTRLLPARSITSLRETAEVHPYLIVSPADLVTMVNALFPEHRPQSSHSSSLRSGAPSISNFSTVSQPISMATSRSQYEAPSIISTSISSTISDTTASNETIDELYAGIPNRHSPDSGSMANYEDDGFRLRFAVNELTQVLGSDVVRGSCHPCAERWAVIFLSSDGNSLSTHMTFDPDDELDEEENSSMTSDTDEEPDERPELDNNYHQLRDSILKLVEDFEIPQGLDKDGSKFSNRTSSLKKYKSKNKIITTEKAMGSRNPYRNVAKAESSQEPEVKEDEEPPNVLVAMLTAAQSQSKAQSDFVSAHLYWKTLQQLNALTSPSLKKDGFATLLNIFSRGPRDSIRRSAAAIEEYDAWLVWLKQSQERHEGLIDAFILRLKGLRDKTWYVTDVRNSKAYEDSRNICVALKTMGSPRQWEQFKKTRTHLHRSTTASFLFRQESQIMDMISAPEEQGGPNKLTDEHVDITKKWIKHTGVEIGFCVGEERIHRFTAEVDSCINKLLGSGVADAPVLWSSELYLRDKRTLENSGREKELFWGGDDGQSVVSDPLEKRGTFPSSRANSIMGDLRNMSLHNQSQASFGSGRYNFPRPSLALSDISDAHDYFGISSPVHTIDSSSTFWSPFQSQHSYAGSSMSRAHSPTTSITNLSSTLNMPTSTHGSVNRPGTSASSNETVLARNSEQKQQFLTELRQTLTSLLLSDLGNLVFAQGSETDGWFDSWGQAMLDLKNAQSKQARAASRLAAKKEQVERAREKAMAKSIPTIPSLPKPRGLEKKKSIGDLRSVHEDKGSEVTETSTIAHESSATSDTVSGRPRLRLRRDKKELTHEFPFTKSYQRLLRMFSVHPSPYAKMNALLELEHLVMASIASGARRSRLAISKANIAKNTISENAAPPRSKAFEESMDNVRERRGQTLVSPLNSPFLPAQTLSQTIARAHPSNAETRSIMSAIGPGNNAVSTEDIVPVLQSLFRDANIRPKTLFRDLQYIASLVPSSVLDRTERGKAYWDVATAALGVKVEVCSTMVEVYDKIESHHRGTATSGASPTPPGSEMSDFSTLTATSIGSHGSNNPYFNSPGTSTPTSLSMAQQVLGQGASLSQYTIQDAITFVTIAAKEGDPTAQRELALSFLTRPERLQRVTVPLSRPSDVFKQALIEMYGPARRHPRLGSKSGPEVGGDGTDDSNRDPVAICLSFHWGEAARENGDEVADRFLFQQDDAGEGGA